MAKVPSVKKRAHLNIFSQGKGFSIHDFVFSKKKGFSDSHWLMPAHLESRTVTNSSSPGNKVLTFMTDRISWD